MTKGDRLAEIEHFYGLLAHLVSTNGGTRRLADCNGRMDWPRAGVYFFFEEGENRSDSGKGLRVTRVGTHAITSTSRTGLWQRLSQHRGVEKTGGGNHRGSVFRLQVGTALINSREEVTCPSWGKGSSASREVRDSENEIETMVSDVIRQMPFTWLPIGDPAGPESMRAYIERNAIALLSNHDRPAIDPQSTGWLGQHARSANIRSSGLWNSNHVEEEHDPAFLGALESLVDGSGTR